MMFLNDRRSDTVDDSDYFRNKSSRRRCRSTEMRRLVGFLIV